MIPPQVVSLVPADASSDVSATSLITASFNEPIRGDAASINASTISFVQGADTLSGIVTLVNEDSVLRTELGRVEMLLTPGVVVRMSEDSALRMISARLSRHHCGD